MKKLLYLLLIIPLVSFGQEQTQATVIKQSTTNSSYTNVENDLVLSEKSINIKTPFTADLSKYTHILLVDCLPLGYSPKWSYKDVKEILSLTVFEIMNPYEVDKKRFKKEPNFLKTIKNESYLYLSISHNRGRGDDTNTTLIIRDWKNKIIYNATHINYGDNEVFAPLIDY